MFFVVQVVLALTLQAILNNEGGLPTYSKMDCLEQKIGVSESHSETRKA